MVRAKLVLSALLPFALHGLAREMDGALGLLLHSRLGLPGAAAQALGLLEPGAVALRLAAWLGGGALVLAMLVAERRRRQPLTVAEGLEQEAPSFWPLYLRPLITLLALVSLWLGPAFPYGSTLLVALTQDWGLAQDALALATILALRVPPLRLPAPRAQDLFLMSFLAYALLSPEWARHWQGHPGNEPKTLRQAVAIGHWLTLDAEGVSGPMEELPAGPMWREAGRSAAALARESAQMLGALAQGPAVVGAEAIRATRITRQTIRGKDGGVFYVLAPGPSLVLAPGLRVDRWLNRLQGTSGRLPVTLLLWNALAALLVAAVYSLACEVSGRQGLSAALAGGFALVPPFLFYFYQFYPEMLGALVLAVAFRQLLVNRWTFTSLLGLGLLVATLPWLHQKFLPVWGVLTLQVGIMAVERMVRLRALLAFLVPQLATLYLTALYNFAITGSVRPDALFLAWGPGGVTSARVGEGLLGLLLDARYGILPYAPIYLLAAGGLAFGWRSKLGLLLPAVVTYYLTVASADNWSGAVCSLGRYFMPVAPLLVAAVAVALARTASRRAVWALALTCSFWTALLTVSLFRDPHAANDCARLLASSVFADGHLYLPDLYFRSPNYAMPGQWARVLAWCLIVVATGLWLRRAALGPAGRFPLRAGSVLVAVALALALGLERWPSTRTAPRFHDSIELDAAVTLFLLDGGVIEADAVRASTGRVDLLVRSSRPLEQLRLEAWGEGWLWPPGRSRVPVRARGVPLDVEPGLLAHLDDDSGQGEWLYRLRLRVESDGHVWLRLRAVEHSGAGSRFG